MKRIVFFSLALLIVLGGISGCAIKPKPEDALEAFLLASQSEEEGEYRDYFDSAVEVFETEDTPDPENPMESKEIEDRLNELFTQFTYEIKSVEKSEDGDTARVTVEMVTVDAGEIMADFVNLLIVKATELSQNGGTEEELTALIAPTFLEAMKDAKIDKLSTSVVKMNYYKENKKWWIAGGDTNLKFIDALMGGMISTMEEYDAMFPAE